MFLLSRTCLARPLPNRRLDRVGATISCRTRSSALKDPEHDVGSIFQGEAERAFEILYIYMYIKQHQGEGGAKTFKQFGYWPVYPLNWVRAAVGPSWANRA